MKNELIRKIIDKFPDSAANVSDEFDSFVLAERANFSRAFASLLEKISQENQGTVRNVEKIGWVERSGDIVFVRTYVEYANSIVVKKWGINLLSGEVKNGHNALVVVDARLEVMDLVQLSKRIDCDVYFMRNLGSIAHLDGESLKIYLRQRHEVFVALILSRENMLQTGVEDFPARMNALGVDITNLRRMFTDVACFYSEELAMPLQEWLGHNKETYKEIMKLTQGRFCPLRSLQEKFYAPMPAYKGYRRDRSASLSALDICGFQFGYKIERDPFLVRLAEVVHGDNACSCSGPAKCTIL